MTNSSKRVHLSRGQKRFWAMSQIENDISAYNIPLVIKFDKNLNTNKIRKSIELIVKKHASLRTLILTDDVGNPFGKVLGVDEYELDFRQCYVEDEESARQWIISFCNERFELDKSLPIKVGIILSNDKNYFVAISLHHHAADDESLSLLLKDIDTYYKEDIESKSFGDQLAPIEYSDWAAWYDKAHAKKLPGALDRAKTRLKDTLHVSTLPGDLALSHGENKAWSYVTLNLDNDINLQLEEFIQNLKISRFSLYLLALGVTLNRLTRQTKCLIGSPVSCRNRKETICP